MNIHRNAAATGATGRNVRHQTVADFARRFEGDPAHARCVADLALAMLAGSRAAHHLDDRAAELLEYGALLHDIGLHIGHSRHNRHSQYLILNCGLKGFADDEIGVIAALARFHRGAPPKNSTPELVQFGSARRKAVMTLAAILRVADGLDRGHRGLVRRVELAREARNWRARVYFRGFDAEPELWAAARKADAWERCLAAPLILDRVEADLRSDDFRSVASR